MWSTLWICQQWSPTAASEFQPNILELLASNVFNFIIIRNRKSHSPADNACIEFLKWAIYYPARTIQISGRRLIFEAHCFIKRALHATVILILILNNFIFSPCKCIFTFYKSSKWSLTIYALHPNLIVIKWYIL